jgi:hypothetical protein
MERLIMLSEALYLEFSGVFRRHVTLNERQLQLLFPHSARDAAPPFTSFQVLRQPRNLSSPEKTSFASCSLIHSVLTLHPELCDETHKPAIELESLARDRGPAAWTCSLTLETLPVPCSAAGVALRASRRRLLNDLKSDLEVEFNRGVLQDPVRIDPAALPGRHGGERVLTHPPRVCIRCRFHKLV